MQQIRTPQDVKKLGTILSVWAHPDDESFCAAGLLAAAVENGQEVICVTATRGEAGVQDETRWPAARLGDIREAELKAALNILGIKKHHWLGYKDGSCHQISDDKGSERIKKFIKKYQPDTILTFGPEGLTGHPDHQAVSRWVSSAAKGTRIKVYQKVESAELYEKYMKTMDKSLNIYFNIDKPPVFAADMCEIAFSLTPTLVRKKHAALKVMPSQTEGMFKDSLKDVIDAGFQQECFRAG